MQFEQWTDLNLGKGRAARVDLGTLYEGDSDPVKVGVRLYDASGPVDVTGTVSGWAVCANGTDSGPFGDVGKADNEAWVIIPQAALIPGRLQVFLRITDGDEYAVTLDALANVARTTTGQVVNPGTPIPNVGQLTQAAADCIAATAAAQAIVDDWQIATVAETKAYLSIE